MRRGIRPELLWGLGLQDTEKSRIEEAMGPGFFVRNFPENSLPVVRDMNDREKPTVAWIPLRVWSKMPESRKEAYREWEDVPRILVESEEDRSIEFEKVLEEGFLTAVRAPLDKPKLQDALFRAKEVSSLYSDIYRMTEEIFLERELLSRKTDQLLFLNKLLAGAAESLDAADILSNTRENLKMILPVKSLQAVMWRKDKKEGNLEAEVFVHSRMKRDVQAKWVELMLESAARMAGCLVGSFHVVHVNHVTETGGEGYAPKDGRIITMPLKVGQEAFGVLIILTDTPVQLAKDQTQTLSAAANHLALALRNALVFKEVKIQADRDGLTKIFNRRSFDERLMEELSRHQRYRHDLSLLMLDLDHFKSVNDTYGHQAGDMVLRDVAGILSDSLRTTDLAARYGGEEFVVILPHTGEEQAWMLAERIRKRIAKKTFQHGGRTFKTTASIGVASLSSGTFDNDQDLVLKVDEALYKAKANGRNMVVVSGRDTSMDRVAAQ